MSWSSGRNGDVKLAKISYTQKVGGKRRRGNLNCDGRTALRETWKDCDEMENKRKCRRNLTPDDREAKWRTTTILNLT